MKKLPVIIASAIISYSSSADAQQLPPGFIETVNPSERAAVLGFNALSNGTLCGIVAAVEGREVLKDSAKCAFAGIMQYTGMELGSRNIPVLPGIGLRTVETAASIVINTISGRQMLDRLYYGFGPALLELDIGNKDWNLYWRLLPAGAVIGNFARGNKLDLAATFSNQAFSFTDKRLENAEGYAFGNIMTYNPEFPLSRSHEFIHVIQYSTFMPAQIAIPKKISFLEKKLHLRLGEDILSGIFNIPLIACKTAEGSYCGRRWWNPTEAGAYVMERE